MTRVVAGVTSGAERNRRAVIAAASMIVTANLPIFLLGALSVQLRDALDLGRAGLGAAIAAVLASAALTSSPLGGMAQRFGPVRSLRASALATAVAALGVAGFAVNWLSLLPWLVLTGIGLSLAESAGNLLLQLRVNPARLGSVFGIKQAAPPLAAMLAGAAVPLAVTAFDWRLAFVVAGALSVGSALVLPPPEPPRPRGDRSGERIRRRAPLVLLSVGLGCGFGATNSVATFLVDSAVSQGVPAARAGVYLSMASGIAIVTRLLAGRLADGRTVFAILRAVTVMMLAGTIGFVLFATQRPGLVLPGALLAFGVGYGWAGLSFLAVARVGGRAAAAASGLVLTGGFVGGLSGPILTGVIADRHGYATAWGVLAAVTAAGALTMARANAWLREVGHEIAPG